MNRAPDKSTSQAIMTTRLYLELSKGEPIMIYTTRDRIAPTKEAREIEYTGSARRSLFIVFDYPHYHTFEEMVDALHFALENEVRPATLWHCAIDEYQDRDEISVESLTMLPFRYISSLEVAYRIHNPRMTAEEAFQEAIAMWKVFGTEDVCVLRALVDRYPDAGYDKTYEHHFNQHDLFVSDMEWTSRAKFLDTVYPGAREPREEALSSSS